MTRLVRGDVRQLLADEGQSFAVRRVDHEHDGVRAHIVSAPHAPQLLLSTEIPDLEAHVAVDDLLDVAAHGRISRDHLAEVSAT
jgi:hypothetical protein